MKVIKPQPKPQPSLEKELVFMLVEIRGLKSEIQRLENKYRELEKRAKNV